MTPLQELLSLRATVSPAEVLLQLEEGLSSDPSQSGAGADVHRLVLDYFKLNRWAGDRSFAAAFKKYPATAEALRALCVAHGLTEVAALMQSLQDGAARPTGAFKAGLHIEAQKLEGQPDKAGVLAGLQGFASAAFASPGHEAEMELSLAWGAIEDCLLDQLAPFSEVIAFNWGPQERLKREKAAAVQSALAASSAIQMLAAFFTDESPHVLAQASEWDISHEGATADVVSIPVQAFGPKSAFPAHWALELGKHPAAAQLLAVYSQINGAALFCTDPHDTFSAGLLLLPAEQWDEAREEVLDWLTAVDFQDDPSELPDWVQSAIPFGKIPGDASYWMLPVEGPYAGKVLLSNDDISAETFRYADFDTFIATLRLQPEAIIGSGGYISYLSEGGRFNLYPVGYQTSANP
ncbi:MAG: hypothetical protein H7Y28_05425 [Rhodoferax sp.]|nr:hypothetical protein [Rhodoferax sp.]